MGHMDACRDFARAQKNIRLGPGMAICRSTMKMTGAKFHARFIVAARLAFGVAALALLALAAATAHAAGAAVSKASQQCLECHAVQGLEKKLANGDTMPLHIDGRAFAKSAHSILGCAVCHAEVTVDNHPPVKKKINSVRENSLAMQKVCSSCHADQFKEHEGSIHASLVREGNPIAPVCTDCHNPHAIVPNAAYDVATGTPCSKCHGGVFEAYAASVHGQARKRGRMEAPACSTCHNAHAVKAAAGGDKIRDTCLGCHSGALSAHQNWLPNAARHLQTVSCAACHAPGAKRRVDLRLYESTAKERMAEKAGVPQLEPKARAVDAEGKGLDASELQRLMRDLQGNGVEGKTILRGRLEVDDGVEAHKLAAKSTAVAQCETCHRAGSDPFQRVTVSIAGADGRPVRYDANQEVLNSATSIDSVGGFYVIGGTRIRLLDVLVLLALAGGVSVPILHLAFGWLSRKYAKKIGGREDS
jgi:hypothetical protein